MDREFKLFTNKLFKEFTSDSFDVPSTIGFADATFPKTDMLDTGDKVIIHLGLAGWNKEDIKIELFNDRLTVIGESKLNNTTEGTYLKRELKRSKFSKQFVLGNNIDRAGIEATYENGLLSISIPKIKRVKLEPTIIPIK
jgi:HSP20 family protein